MEGLLWLFRRREGVDSWWVCWGACSGGRDHEVLSQLEHEAQAWGHRAWGQSPCPHEF